jgi:hypothetical protein
MDESANMMVLTAVNPISTELPKVVPRLTSSVANAERIAAKELFFSQEGISWSTKRGIPLDELAQDIAEGWKGDPIRVVEVDGKLVSLDNRRLAAAKLIDAEVPIERVSLDDPNVARVWRQRDGVLERVKIHGREVWIDKNGRIIEE